MPADEIFFNIAKSEKQAQRLQKITTRGRELEDRIESNHEIYATISSALEEKHENRKALKRRLSFSQSKYYELGQERNNELLAIRNEHMNQLLAIRDKYKHADEMRVNIDVMEEDLSTEMDETKSLSIKLIDVSDEISSLKNKQNENIQKKRTLTRAIERSQNATFLLSQRQIFALMQKAGSFPRTLSNADEILDLDAESKDQEEDQDDDKEITCVICVYDYDPKTRVKMGHGSTSTSDGKIECVGHMCKPCLLRLATMLPRNCPFCRASLLKYPWSPFNTCKR